MTVEKAAPADDSSREEHTPLRRAITGKLLFVFILGDVLGAGIYALVGEIAGEVGGAVWVPLLLALVMALLTAASYAELVTKYPRAGGAAVFAATLPFATHLYVTEIDLEVPGDVFFPDFDESAWRETDRRHSQDERLCFRVLERVS